MREDWTFRLASVRDAKNTAKPKSLERYILSPRPVNHIGGEGVGSEIERIANVIIRRPNQENPVAAMAIYGDESGSANIFVLSTYIATVESWARFEGSWKATLEEAGLRDESGKLQPFHMSAFESRFKPFDTWNNAKRVRVLRSLIETIHATQAIGVTVALPLDLYRKGISINAHLALDHPLHKIMQYMICFYTLHLLLLRRAASLGLPEPLTMVLDRNDVSAGMVRGVLDLASNEWPKIMRLIDTPVFCDKSIVVQLQSADILAYESMKCRDNVISGSGRPMRKSYDYLLIDRARHIIRDCDEKYISEIASMMFDYAASAGLIEGT
ncbi:MAG: hypothetical protein ABI165_12775 [Bryobacteraceae bacterium]